MWGFVGSEETLERTMTTTTTDDTVADKAQRQKNSK